MYLKDITPKVLENLSHQVDRIEASQAKNECDYWKAKWKNNCTEPKSVYISASRYYLTFRCSKHKGNYKKLSEKEVFYLKCSKN